MRAIGRHRIGWALCVCAAVAHQALGTDYTWNGPAGGDWFANTNWSPNGVPGTGVGDAALIQSGSVVLSNSSGLLAAFTITNATLTFTNWATALSATEVVIRNNGKLTHKTCSYTNTPAWSNRVYIIASNVTLDAGGSLDAVACGYVDGGPGAGISAEARQGGSYGGSGGGQVSNTRTYGLPDAAGDPGSRGYSENTKGYGGGVVRIEATGQVRIDGVIKVDGQGAPGYSACGSGGGVYIRCLTIAGSGGIFARGGDGSGVSSAGGGGGRIAIFYSSPAQALAAKPSVLLSAAAGNTTDYAIKAQFGTVCLPDARILPDNLSSNSGWFVGVTNWIAGQVTLIKGAVGFANLTNLCVSNLTLNASTLALGSGSARTNLVVTSLGDLVLTNSSRLDLYSGLTNSVWTNGGARVVLAGDMVLASNCWVYPYSHPTNGGCVWFDGRSLTVMAGGGIIADGAGFIQGYGLGRGKASRTGGGYGGRGQGYSAANGGDSYGSSNAPVDPGSPGFTSGTAGGGLIHFVATDTITVDGTLRARGANAPDYCGAGSGGGIYLSCHSFAGSSNGLLDASGGSAGLTYGSSGGGGRIAVYRAQHFYTGNAVVSNGSGSVNYTPAAQPGSIVWSNLTVAGTRTLTVAGRPAAHGTSAPYVYGDNVITDGTWVTNRVNSPADTANGVRYTCLGWTLTNAAGPVAEGSTTQAVFLVDTNLWLTWNWTSECYLAATAGTNGALDAEVSGWYTNGTVVVTLRAVPNGDRYFLQWTGDLLTNQYDDVAPVLTMDRPRTVVAHFASLTAESKTWTGSGDWFGNDANWTPGGAPGRADAVTIASGTTTVGFAVGLQSLTVNGNLRMAGDGAKPSLSVSNGILISGTAARVTLSNADLMCDSLTLTNGGAMSLYAVAASASTNHAQLTRVMQDLVIASNCWIYPYSHPTNGASALFQVGRLRIDGPIGGFNADGRGWNYPHGPGFPSGAGAARWGGSYGGVDRAIPRITVTDRIKNPCSPAARAVPKRWPAKAAPAADWSGSRLTARWW